MAHSINVSSDLKGHITVTEIDADGEIDIFTVTHEDPNFLLYYEKAVSAMAEGEDLTMQDIRDTKAIITPLEELSDRVSVNDDVITFDGEPVHDALARTVHRYWREQRPYGGLLRFMERLSCNPHPHSQEHLWQWVSDRNLEVDKQGFFIAYKGVRNDLTSISSGWANVDDVLVEGNIPNEEGTVISMPRSEVEHDPAVGCSFGLHVGTESYARSFGHGTVVVCRVDPKDVVSVPTDCGFEKMRVCRYEVVDVWEPQVDYEPTLWDDDYYDDLAENAVERTPHEARSVVQRLFNRLRGH